MPGYVGEDRNQWPPDISLRWARDEFDRLRIAVTTFGTGNLELIARFVVTKSVDEVIKMLPYFTGSPSPHDLHMARPAPQAPHLAPVPSSTMGYTSDMAHSAPQQGQETFSTRPSVLPADAPPAVGTVTLSQLASMRTSGSSPTIDTGALRTSNNLNFQPSTSAHSDPAPTETNYAHTTFRMGVPNTELTSSLGTPNYQMSQHLSQAPSQHLNTASTAANRAFTPQGNAGLAVNALQAPNGVGTFGSFSTASPHHSTAPIISYPEIHTSVSTSDTYQAMTQPAISISMYEAPGGTTSSPSGRRGSFVAKSTGGYIPAPGQAHVNMDKTVLFTPSNPPRPGSPRPPRSPKSPKSPNSTAPHSPKSPRPEQT